MRLCQAVITLAEGKTGTVKQFPVKRVEAYATMESMDGDVDTFSVDIGDSDDLLIDCLDRDNEVRVDLFLNDLNGHMVQIFAGLGDMPQRDESKVLSIAGRDTPSALAFDSDCEPGRWRGINPKSFIEGRAHKLGVATTKIASMGQIANIYTDGTESEWVFWYRIARMKGMYMWSDNKGSLIIDHLGYSLTPTYRFGDGGMGVEDLTFLSNKQTRKRTVLVYGQTTKKKGKGLGIVAQGLDPSIRGWKKKPLNVVSSTGAKTQADLQTEADLEIFESIVGAQEIQVTVRDTGVLIQQNKMAYLNLPTHGINNEVWFIVGVQRQGGDSGLTQIVRLREKGFALTKRVPTAPILTKDTGANKAATSIGDALRTMGVTRWADSFVRATKEFGTPAGWDFAVFLGTLLSICQVETGFRNIRGTVKGAINDVEWESYDTWLADYTSAGDSANRETAARHSYEMTYANERTNPLNPRYPNSNDAVGPMQLVSDNYVAWADNFGWNGSPRTGEFQGGRWNPDSNIRAAAKALVNKLEAAHADPNTANTIWLGVQLYGGSPGYATAVKAQYDAIFGAKAAQAVAMPTSLPPNSTVIDTHVPGYGEISLPGNTPDPARKAINFAQRHLGDAYLWGGGGPLYDCSSFVTAALAAASPALAAVLDEPHPGHHGEDTYSLFKSGRFQSIPKDSLLPGDLVFARGNPPEHVALYIVDGIIIEDPSPGKNVQYSHIGSGFWADNYTGARRLITWPTVNHPVGGG